MATISTASSSNHLLLASVSLWRREMVRFFRQRNRVVSAFATPLVFWLLLGSGLNRSFTAADNSSGYLEFFYPGTIVLMLMFTAIFSTISVIEDRREGFMQGVLAAPAPRLAIVMGKVLGGASIATVQGMAMLALWPVIGDWPGPVAALEATVVMFVLAIGMTGLGMAMAWPCESTASFHAVMNLLLMPMWFLSGAVFPLQRAPGWMQAVMYCNPLTYGQAAFTATLYGGTRPALDGAISLPVDLLLTVLLSAAGVALATVIVLRPRKDGTR